MGVLALSFIGREAQAQGVKSWFVCGGTTFNTCAAVVLNVGAPDSFGISQVQMKVLNFSGSGSWGSYGGTVFTKIGFFNTGSVVALQQPLLAMTGPVRYQNGVPDTPLAWVVGDPNNAGGVSLNFGTASNTKSSNVDDGIASACDPTLSPGGQNQLWENPCFSGNLLPSLLTAIVSGATLGEICDELRAVFGEHRAPELL